MSVSSKPLVEMRDVRKTVLAEEARLHPTSPYYNIGLSSGFFTVVEGGKIVLEETGHPNLANALGTFNGSPGAVGMAIDFFKLWELPNQPYVAPRSTLFTRLPLAAAAGAFVGLGMVPNPDITFGLAGTSALRRIFIETIGYGIDGETRVNPHISIVASGLVTLARSGIPYWGNYPLAEGENRYQLLLNAFTDITIEVGWEYLASLATVGIDDVTEDSLGDENFWIYPNSRILPSAVPPLIANVIAAPIRPNPKRLQSFRDTADHAGFDMDAIFSDRVVFRQRWWNYEESKANTGVLFPFDFRPAINVNPNIAARFMFTEPGQSFYELWRGTEALTDELRDYATLVHEGLHLSGAFGLHALDEEGRWKLYGGQGPILHHGHYLSGMDEPYEERAGEQVELKWSRGFKRAHQNKESLKR